MLAAPPVVRADATGGSSNGLALTPPMGFNDWNAYYCNVSASLIEQTALAMHNNGMQAAGYKYVNIDDCWILGRDPSEIPPGQTKASVGRGPDGHLIADPNYFPPSAPSRNDGIKVVADYMHSLGLKLGIYEDTGTATCQGLAGTYKGPNGATYDTIGAQDFAAWGVDYLKDDWCNVPLSDVPGATRDKANYLYTQMSQALRATGPAHGPVVLKVSSPANLITDQLAVVGNAGGGSFAAQLQAALGAVNADETRHACGLLGAYVNHVRAQSGKQLDTALANQLLAGAQQIQALLSCRAE